MEHPEYISLPLIYSQVTAGVLSGMIDNSEFIKHQYNYIFAGTKDTTVNPANALLLRMMWDHYSATYKTEFDIASEHAFITDAFGKPCDYKGEPFINNCNFNLVHDLMTTFYPNLQRPQQPLLPSIIDQNLFKLDQYLFIPPMYLAFSAVSGINRLGYLYVPTACRDTVLNNPLFNTIAYSKQRADDTASGKGRAEFEKLRQQLWLDSVIYDYYNGTNANDQNTLLYNPDFFAESEEFSAKTEQNNKQCKFHLALHGCKQTVDLIGEEYVRNTGYVDYAEENNIIVLFPQTTATVLNPNSCWDWWGYSGVNYATKYSVQGMTVVNMATTFASMLKV
eukprot:UN02831